MLNQERILKAWSCECEVMILDMWKCQSLSDHMLNILSNFDQFIFKRDKNKSSDTKTMQNHTQNNFHTSSLLIKHLKSNLGKYLNDYKLVLINY